MKRRRGQRLSRKEYAACQTALATHTETLWLRLADGVVDERKFARLDDKLMEWGAELERKRPIGLRVRLAVG